MCRQLGGYDVYLWRRFRGLIDLVVDLFVDFGWIGKEFYDVLFFEKGCIAVELMVLIIRWYFGITRVLLIWEN